MSTQPLTRTRHRHRVLPSIRANVHTLATAAVFAQYPFLLSMATPRSKIKVSEHGWIVTVWLCRDLFRRVAVSRDGRTQLLPSEYSI